MPPRLIINADDFGLTPGVNRAIAELHEAGAITSATLMANGAAFDGAVAIAHKYPTLGIGCHVVLTDGVPVSDPAMIPTLLGSDGRSFRSSLPDFLLSVLRGKVSQKEIALEALAQIRKLENAGIKPTHLDTHKHTHILPGVARPLLQVAEQTGINAIRKPFEKPWSLAPSHSPLSRKLQVKLSGLLRKRFESLRQIASQKIATADGSIGISATGNLDRPTLEALLQSMPDGVWELVCHPGYNDCDLDAITTRLRTSREIERTALLEVFTQPLPVELIHYGKLGTTGVLRELRQFLPPTGHEKTL